MTKSGTNAQTNLLEHSEAKVRLYGEYLSAYLSVLGEVSTIQKVLLFDVLCGEGIYENGAKGSPLIALDVLEQHYSRQGNTRPKLEILFNDLEYSQIEKNTPKIDRVKRFSQKYSLPKTVKIDFSQKDYEQVLPELIAKVNNQNKVKALFFIDPYGYKGIKPADLENILSNGNTEILLFLPIAQMYRFKDPALEKKTSGSEPLRLFLSELFKTTPNFSSVYDFISQLKKQFRAYLSPHKIYVDTFSIERDASNIYCLFFFTSSIRGYEKMLETKWRVDPTSGKGFTREKTLSFLNEVEMSGYDKKLENYIFESKHRTNQEIFEFGLGNGFLPKHSNEILKLLREKHIGFEVFPLDDKPVRKSATYISDRKRKVGIRIKRTLL